MFLYLSPDGLASSLFVQVVLSLRCCFHFRRPATLRIFSAPYKIKQ